MNQVHRLAFHVLGVVRIVERVKNLHRNEHADRSRQANLLLRGCAEQGQAVEAVHKFQSDEVLAVDLAEVGNLDDLRVDELRGELGLVDEHGDEGLVCRQIGQDAFNDQQLLETMAR